MNGSLSERAAVGGGRSSPAVMRTGIATAGHVVIFRDFDK